jgi:putative ABC transport system ATP-binding protein
MSDLSTVDLSNVTVPESLYRSRAIQEGKRPIVSLKDVRKTYIMGKKGAGPESGAVIVHALRGGSVDFFEGEYVAIMGASGSGKSTMLNLLGCLDRPSSGQYYMGPNDVANMSDDDLSDVRSRYIGFIFQSYNLIQQYTVLENIQLPLTYQGNGEISREQDERTVQLAEMVGLGERLDHRPMQLSGGQQQRVAIARSLINDPYIILADEATGNLDTKTSHEIMTMLGNLNESGKTIIMVTHEDDIAEHAKRIIRMRDGQIVEDGPSRRMYEAAARLQGIGA